MKKQIFLVLAVLALVSLACSGISIRLGDNDNENIRIEGSGDLVTQDREVSGFDRVQFNTIGELNISQGDQESLTIEAEENIIDYIETEVRGNTLYIETRRGISLDITRNLTINLVVKGLREINMNGLGELNIPAFEANDLRVEMNGAGDIDIDDLFADSLEVSINGLGGVRVDGEVESQQVEINASGNYDAADLLSHTASISLDGLGSATVWVTDDLDVNISGAGNVNYYGDARVTQDINGLGRVDHRGDK